jgi:DNA-binding Xre family transcriptional regulator
MMRTSILVDALAIKYGSISAASRQADIPMATLFKLKRTDVDMRLSTLLCVANALGCPVSEVIRIMEEYGGAVTERRGGKQHG